MRTLVWRLVYSGAVTWVTRLGCAATMTGSVLALVSGSGGRYQSLVLMVFFPLIFPVHFITLFLLRALSILQGKTHGTPRNWNSFDVSQFPRDRRRWIYVSAATALALMAWALVGPNASPDASTLWFMAGMTPFYVGGYQAVMAYLDMQNATK